MSGDSETVAVVDEDGRLSDVAAGLESGGIGAVERVSGVDAVTADADCVVVLDAPATAGAAAVDGVARWSGYATGCRFRWSSTRHGTGSIRSSERLRRGPRT
ncbi:hypothetical protein GJ629_08280 [Halapricum sp. CBA1109]|uniref:hypothetical protein n=1 Tax=Halapricum sp. CBA1109 TaxID=2668068 RepID=UPI0012F7E611|nr:hypothetical protein [Halapricum sp. CBA1109]MUV89890.1 hypothetical protein [Halapricum sp. CBA1109]